MANTKIELSKKDMNFFSEFTGSSGQMNAYIPYILLILVAFVVVGGVIFGFFKLQTAAVNSQIDQMKAEMNSDENQKSLEEYNNIYNSLADYNLQYYDVSSLLSTVKSTAKDDSTVMDAVYASLPADMYITAFTYDTGSVKLIGSCNSYFSPLDMLANLRKVSLFSNVEITNIIQQDFTNTTYTPEEIATLNQYSFDITCYLKNTYPVVVSRLIDDTKSTPLTAVDSQTKSLGESYEIKGVNTFTSDNGTVYTISRVLVNNTLLTDAELATVKQNDSITGLTKAAVDIKIYYIQEGGVQA